ncbi:MAG TPA: hypothetical protein VKR53_16815 [Puia sp.]|nr:hypothetical protein [Puia sp.]
MLSGLVILAGSGPRLHQSAQEKVSTSGRVAYMVIREYMGREDKERETEQ